MHIPTESSFLLPTFAPLPSVYHISQMKKSHKNNTKGKLCHKLIQFFFFQFFLINRLASFIILSAVFRSEELAPS